jgi:hypothetical protein
MAVFRSNKRTEANLRFDRSNQIYRAAMQRSKEVAELVPHIVYLSAMLIHIAGDAKDKKKILGLTTKGDTIASLSRLYPCLADYFANGTIDAKIYGMLAFVVAESKVD